MSYALSEVEYFHACVDRTPTHWFWLGTLDKNGYGRFRQNILAHRYAWQLEHGPIDSLICVLHSCDVDFPPGDRTYRRCVRPDHLHLGDKPLNQAELAAKGRAQRGEQRWSAKLTDESVGQILELLRAGSTNTAIATQFGVGQSIISKIRTGKGWRHVPRA